MNDADTPARPDVDAAVRAIDGVEGWLSADQARRLFARAAVLGPGARIVEIGSFRGRSTIVLACAAAPGVRVVAIEPHAGTDRGPNERVGYQREAAKDGEVFEENLRRAGVAGRVEHVRKLSGDAHTDVDGDVAILFVDGAHRYRFAVADLRDWGDRVPVGGTMLVHDAFSSIGVTLAILRTLAFGGRFRYAGRTGSLAEYERERWLTMGDRAANAARQLAQLPWFLRNLAIKALILARLGKLTRLLGHPSADWPY